MDEILLEAIERYTGQGYELETLTPDGVATLVRGDETLQLRMEHGEAIATVQAADAGARAGRTLRLVRYAGFGAVAVLLSLIAVAVFRGARTDSGTGDANVPQEQRPAATAAAGAATRESAAEPAATPAAPTATATATPSPAATATPTPGGGIGPVALRPAFGGDDWNEPLDLGPYLPGLVHVAEQGGRVWVVDENGSGHLLLDLSERVLREHLEEGLLSAVVDPRFAENDYFYVYYSAADPVRTVLSRFTVVGDAADVESELVILEVEQFSEFHHGGTVRFGPDGMLYLGLGDGGPYGDPNSNAQNLALLHGAIIRIDVRDASAQRLYAIPPDNPFVGREGARPEIWAYGFRNPWRMSFDPMTGALWVGDAGHNRLEEIDVVEPGKNYGWNRLEGDLCFPESVTDCDTDGTVLPVAQYGHDQGCAIIGGGVYRGNAIPSLRGAYVYADWCFRTVLAVPPQSESAPVLLAQIGAPILSLGFDGAGEVYVLPEGGPIFRLVAADSP